MNTFLHADNGQLVNKVKWETFGEESIPHYQVASWLLTVTYVECIAVDASNCTDIMYL